MSQRGPLRLDDARPAQVGWVSLEDMITAGMRPADLYALGDVQVGEPVEIGNHCVTVLETYGGNDLYAEYLAGLSARRPFSAG